MVKDIILDDSADLNTSNGDFVVGASDQQHVTLIVNTFEGHWKQFPLQGVGIIQYTGSSGQGQTLRRSITVKCEADGYQNISVNLVQGSDGVFDYYVDAIRP